MPVVKDDVVQTLLSRGQPRAARLVARMPAEDGCIEAGYLDALGLRIHRELQRLGEELQLDRRMAALLLEPLRRLGASSAGPVSVVDVGCGLGYVVRAAAARRLLGPEVRLIGVDLNPLLVEEARRLATAEELDCEFVAGDALASVEAVSDPAMTVVISTGFLHHLGEVELEWFFGRQASLGVAGFAHWDIAPCLWSTAGAWIFHQARMREPISRHDGTMSARRAHPAEVLLAVARGAAPDYAPEVLEGPRWYPRALDVLRPIVGWRTC